MIAITTERDDVISMKDRRLVLNYVQQKALNVRKTIIKYESDTTHIILRCLMSDSEIEVKTDEDDLIEWLDSYLKKDGWYVN